MAPGTNMEDHFRKWKSFNWWQAISSTEDIQVLWDDLQSRQIRVNNDNDKIIWEFSQFGTFNMKEAARVIFWGEVSPIGYFWGFFQKINSLFGQFYCLISPIFT